MRRITIEVHGADDDEMSRILNYWFPPMGFPDVVNADPDVQMIRHETGLACPDECEHCIPDINDVLVGATDNATKSAMLAAARAFCAGTPENVGSEYVRGQAELICDTLGIGTDRKDDVAAWLCEDDYRSKE